jgi:regulator of CtrA degradation
MAEPADLSPTIIESLYSEALLLADEARATFDLSGRLDIVGEDEDLARVALSCEALRTTTRMMHAIAWLLNQRAFFTGEISEFQLRHHGRLPPAQPASSPEQLEMLGPDTQELIRRTERFLDAQLLFLERLENPIIGRRSAQFVTQLGFEPGVLGLKGGDVRVVHRAFSWSAVASLTTPRWHDSERLERRPSRAIVI